ncbi:MAG: hypothetical protein GY757_17180, partial [bacterium]|nr:hypothetical protein [bacterium]
MKQYKALIFDMGNVVFQCLPNDVYNYFSEVSNLTVTQLKKTFRPGTAYKKFERDELTPHQFYLHIKTLLESINPGAKGNAGLNENVTPGLTGSATPGLTGSATPGLTGSATPGLTGSATPGLAGV